IALEQGHERGHRRGRVVVVAQPSGKFGTLPGCGSLESGGKFGFVIDRGCGAGAAKAQRQRGIQDRYPPASHLYSSFKVSEHDLIAPPDGPSPSVSMARAGSGVSQGSSSRCPAASSTVTGVMPITASNSSGSSPVLASWCTASDSTISVALGPKDSARPGVRNSPWPERITTTSSQECRCHGATAPLASVCRHTSMV